MYRLMCGLYDFCMFVFDEIELWIPN